MATRFGLVWAFFIVGAIARPQSSFETTPPFGRRQLSNLSTPGLQERISFDMESADANSSPATVTINFIVGSEFGNTTSPDSYLALVSYIDQNGATESSLQGAVSTIQSTDTSGNWSNFGTYMGNGSDWSAIKVGVDSRALSSSGTLNLEHSVAPPSWACGPGKGTNLASLVDEHSSAAETKTLHGTNWAHLAGGVGSVDMVINGSTFKYSGPFESQHNWGLSYPDAYSRFILGHATVGPYVFAFWTLAPLGEPDNWATIGYVGGYNKVLYSACNKASTVRTKKKARTIVTPSNGIIVAPATFPLPGKIVLEYESGEECEDDFIFEIELPQKYSYTSFFGIGTYSAQSGVAKGGKRDKGQAVHSGTVDVQSWVVAGGKLLD